MNTDIAEGKWKEIKGKVKQKWGELTDDEIDQIEGRRDRFVGVMQQKYGKGKEVAEREFESFNSY
jgi:uncharacterized protein YjbJ (UPF0337 family)